MVAPPIAGYIIDSVGLRWLPALGGLVLFAAFLILRSVESHAPKTSRDSKAAG